MCCLQTLSLPCRFRAALLFLACFAMDGFAPASYATTVIPPEFGTLVNESDYIIHAVAKTVTAEKRATAYGTKIYTLVEFDVLEVIAGHPPAKVLLEFLGGRVGDEQMSVEGMPRFKAGDEDILFVSGNGRSICPLYAMMHGRFPVSRDPATSRKIMTRAGGAPLHATAQITSMPATESTARLASSPAMSPVDFIREIKAAVRPDGRVNREK